MSAIIPWNDPGGAPCCCVSCIGLPESPSAWREIEITATEFAQIYAGGTIVTEQTMSASATSFIGTTRTLTVNGTPSTKFEHTLSSSFNLLGITRQPGCDKFGTNSIQEVFSPNSSYEYSLLPTDTPILVEGSVWSSYSFNTGAPNLSEIIQLAPYNLPFAGNPFSYGLYINRQSQGLLTAGVVFINQLNLIVAQANPSATMSSSADNSTFELVLPERTVEIPIRVAGGTFSQHRVTYSPSAP